MRHWAGERRAGEAPRRSLRGPLVTCTGDYALAVRSTKYSVCKRHTEDNWHVNHEEDKVEQVAFAAPEGWG